MKMSGRPNMPVVTVLIPVHNDEKYIGSAIDSALNQDYEAYFRLCVIDDGSSDRSWDIAITKIFSDREVETKEDGDIILVTDGKHVVIKKPEASGPSGARNTGIKYTLHRTDIYAMLDSDDEMYPSKVSKCVEKILEDLERIGAVYADYDTINVDTNKTIREFKEPFNRQRLFQECIVHSGSVVNRMALEASIEETGFYDETMRTCEDYDLWMRISDNYMIVHIPESLTKVRVTGDNSSFIINKDVWQRNWSRVMEKASERHNA